MVGSGSLTPGTTSKTPLVAGNFYTPAAWIIIQSRQGNTGNIRVGDSTITAGAGGVALQPSASAPGGSLTLPYISGANPYDLSQINVITANTTDAVDFIYGRV